MIIDKHFPFDQYNPGQKEAIEFAINNLLAGKKASLNCVLEHDESINSFEMLNKENVILEVQEPSDPKNRNIIENIYQNL